MSNPDPPVLLPPKFLTKVLELVECVCAHVESEGAGAVCWCGLYPGQAVSFDYCGECDGGACGMAWVRPTQFYPSDTFPLPTIDMTCTKPLALGLEVGVVRCMPLIGADGELPSNEDMNIAGIAQLLDAMALYKAIACCEGVNLTVEQWQPASGGGCAGGFWTVFLDTNVA